MVTVTVTPEKWMKGSPHPRPMREWCVPTKRKEVDEAMEEREQGGEAKPTEDVDDKPATLSENKFDRGARGEEQ